MNISTSSLEELNIKNDYYVYEYFIKENNVVFYVGKGNKNRAWTDTRNASCEQIKREFEWDIRKVKENLTEEEALKLEKQLIIQYRESGIFLTNILPGGIKSTDSEIVGNVKYLLFLLEKKVININFTELANLFLISSTTVWNIAKEGHYSDVEPLIPHNIDEIINTYHSNVYNEERTRAGNIKYLLTLLDNGVIKTNQAKIAEYFNMTASNVSSIKKGQTHADVPPIIPADVSDIFKKFNPFYLSEEENLKGQISYIIRLRNEKIISITNADIATILNVSPYLISEFTRTNEERKYQYKEVKPTPEVMVKFYPYFTTK